MDSNQKDKYDMLLKVDDFFDDHSADTASHSRIAPKHLELKGVIKDMEEAAMTAEADQTGVTEDKAALRTELEKLVFTARTAVAGLARDTPDRKLLRSVSFTLNDLRKMSDATLFFKGSMVRSRASTHLAALADYAYAPAQLTALTDTLADFLDIASEPLDAIDERAVANEQVAALLAKAEDLLESLDGYMDTFRFSLPMLYTEYSMARGIDDTGGRKQEVGP